MTIDTINTPQMIVVTSNGVGSVVVSGTHTGVDGE